MNESKGGALDALIRDRGYTPYSLSRKSGVAERTIRKLCKLTGDEAPIRMNTVRKLAEALGMEHSEVVSILQGDGLVVGSQA